MPRKKKSDWNLMTAIETVWSEAHESELSSTMFRKIKDATDYIDSKLHVTPMQCVILSALVDNGNELTTRNIAHFTKTTNLRMMMYENEFNDLADRKFVIKGTTYDHGERSVSYKARPETISAFRNDKEFDGVKMEKFNVKRFLTEVESIVDVLNYDNHDEAEVFNRIKDLVESCQQFNICKLLKSIGLSRPELFLFFVALNERANNHCDQIVRSDYEDCIDEYDLTDLLDEIHDGSSKLIKEELLEHVVVDGIADPESFRLTEKIRRTALKEFGLYSNSNFSANVVAAEKIGHKDLYYNKREDTQIDELKDLLSEEKYNGIRERLKQSGFRMGFTCLFYGSPGTGKTETVLQLAKMTGRGIMQVNISQIKSKWVGDSEKNIQQIFTEYRNAVEIAERDSNKVPILLFNEADAIFSTRKEGATNAVDKMENAIQNIILQEMEKLDGILIATTNLTMNLDSAFDRRFLYKIQFDKPQKEVKQKIWKAMINDITDDDAAKLSTAYDFSGGQIENIARKMAINHILYNSSTELTTLDKFCKEEILSKSQTRQRIGFAS